MKWTSHRGLATNSTRPAPSIKVAVISGPIQLVGRQYNIAVEEVERAFTGCQFFREAGQVTPNSDSYTQLLRLTVSDALRPYDLALTFASGRGCRFPAPGHKFVDACLFVFAEMTYVPIPWSRRMIRSATCRCRIRASLVQRLRPSRILQRQLVRLSGSLQSVRRR